MAERGLAVLATGYRSMQDGVRALLGDEVVDHVGPVWGIGEDGEIRNMWRPTGQPGLWLMGGNLQQTRFYSKYLALQIAADLPA